jgi:hypothetical protein
LNEVALPTDLKGRVYIKCNSKSEEDLYEAKLKIIIAIVLPIIFSLSFKMLLIPAVGGVITELVAGTALAVYRNSLAQLNHYHKALHEDERFLSSVNLLGKFSAVEAQDDMLWEIVRSEIQMNLYGLGYDEKMKTNALKKKIPNSVFA